MKKISEEGHQRERNHISVHWQRKTRCTGKLIQPQYNVTVKQLNIRCTSMVFSQLSTHKRLRKRQRTTYRSETKVIKYLNSTRRKGFSQQPQNVSQVQTRCQNPSLYRENATCPFILPGSLPKLEHISLVCQRSFWHSQEVTPNQRSSASRNSQYVCTYTNKTVLLLSVFALLKNKAGLKQTNGSTFYIIHN